SKTVVIRSAAEWKGDPTPLEDYWSHSALDSLEFVQSDATKAHALVVFSRYKADGTRYISYPTLWIVTRIDGAWRTQSRSTLAPGVVFDGGAGFSARKPAFSRLDPLKAGPRARRPAPHCSMRSLQME